MAKVTNKDIARLAGVSPAAVSIAINGRDGISDKTRERILKIARQQNYYPNAAAMRMMRERSPYIAALFRTDAQLEDQIFYSELELHAMVACRERGYNLIPTFIVDEDGTVELPQALRTGEVDGVLVFGDQEPGIYTELTRTGVPFVVLDSSRGAGDYPAVVVDYAEAAYQATRYLIEMGHRDIAYLSNGTLHDFNTLTLAGFQRATIEAGIALYPNRFQIDVENDESLRLCVDRALAGPARPTAIFCTVDIYAINVIRYLYTQGIRVPDDLSIVSIDDIAMSKFLIPALTTFHIDRKGMIEMGLDMLAQKMDGVSCPNRKLPVSELIRRESVKRRA